MNTTLFEEMQLGDPATFRQRLMEAMPDVGSEALNNGNMGLLSIFFSFQRTMEDFRQGTPTNSDWEKVGYDVESLALLTENQFQMEEDLMERSGHKNLMVHRAEHHVFTRKLEKYRQAVKDKDLKQIFGLKYELFDMFMHHIKETDVKFKDDIKRA